MKLKSTINVILMLMLLITSAAQAQTWLDGYAQAVIAQTNQERMKQGLAGLRVDAELMTAAPQWQIWKRALPTFICWDCPSSVPADMILPPTA